MRRNRYMPEEDREFPIVGAKYDDAEESYLPLFDEGFYDDEYWSNEAGE